MNSAEALCRAEGDQLRRALTVAFGDAALARRATVAAFAAADRRWRMVSTYSEPMVWVDVAAVRHARRALAASERRWRAPDSPERRWHTPDAPDAPDAPGVDGLAPIARAAVVLRALRGRRVDDIAAALDWAPATVMATLREAYSALGVVDVGLDEPAGPYAT